MRLSLPQVVKVAETPQAEWDAASGVAWVVAERGKHLKVMGHRRKETVRNQGGGTEEAAREGEVRTGLVLHAEEALLLVQQGLLLLRRRGDAGVMSAEELQALAIGEEGGRVSLRHFRAYACLREHGFVVLRASALPPQELQNEEASGDAPGNPPQQKYTYTDAEIYEEESRGAPGNPPKYGEGGREPVLAVWRAEQASRKGAAVHPTPYTLHPTPYTLHPTPYTLHSTPRTLHPTPYTPRPAHYTLHPSPYTLHPTP